MTWHTIVPWYGTTTSPTLRSKRNRAFGELGGFLDNVLEDFFERTPSTLSNQNGVNFAPKLNIEDSEEAYRVTLEAPGTSKDDINIAIEDNHLVVAGEKREDFDKSEGKSHYIGRSYGRFERRIPFGVEIDRDAVTAEMENGILAIVLPKKKEAQDSVKKVSIK